MAMVLMNFRTVQEADDLERMDQLCYKSFLRSGILKSGIKYRNTNVKSIFFPELDGSRNDILKTLRYFGFVAEQDNKIQAFIMVGVSPDTNNGYIDFYYNDGYEIAIKNLLPLCEQVIGQHGGTKLYKPTTLMLGQIRNEEISLWERYGFITNNHYHVMMSHHHLNEWTCKEDFNSEGITYAEGNDISLIFGILEDDKEYFLAEEFRVNYPEVGPNHIFLIMKDVETGSIKAVSYYKVWEQEGDSIALSFGVHFHRKGSTFSQCMRSYS
jgi:hypothetical protein